MSSDGRPPLTRHHELSQARKSADMQGPLKVYPSITGAEFIAQAMKVRFLPFACRSWS